MSVHRISFFCCNLSSRPIYLEMERSVTLSLKLCDPKILDLRSWGDSDYEKSGWLAQNYMGGAY